MKDFNYGKKSLEQRVLDYAKALSGYSKFEQGLVNGNESASYTIPGVQEALDSQSMDKYKIVDNKKNKTILPIWGKNVNEFL